MQNGALVRVGGASSKNYARAPGLKWCCHSQTDVYKTLKLLGVVFCGDVEFSHGCIGRWCSPDSYKQQSRGQWSCYPVTLGQKVRETLCVPHPHPSLPHFHLHRAPAWLSAPAKQRHQVAPGVVFPCLAQLATPSHCQISAQPDPPRGPNLSTRCRHLPCVSLLLLHCDV